MTEWVCRGCKDRYPVCWSKCERYKAQLEQYRKNVKIANKSKEATAYTIDLIDKKRKK